MNNTLLRAVALTLWLALLGTTAEAGTGRDRLNAFFDEVQAIRADFVQTVFDADFQIVQETRGTMHVQRPGQFRWDYDAPYKQQIVGDGRKVWLYDVDLEQITVKAVDAAIGNTPAVLLSGSEPLEKNFVITELREDAKLSWVGLQPVTAESGFESMILVFSEQGLEAMDLRDSFGQITRLEFSKVKHNPKLDPGLFVFVPPKGVDVIGDTN